MEKCPYYIKGRFLGQFIEIVRFARNLRYRDFRGLRIRILCQNPGNTIFGGPRFHFCRNISHNFETVGRKASATTPLLFSSNFTLGLGTYVKIFESSKFGKMFGQFMEFVRIAGNFGYRCFRGPRIRILYQNQGNTNLVDLGSISAGTLVIITKRWVVRNRRPHHRFFRLILHKVRAHL